MYYLLFRMLNCLKIFVLSHRWLKTRLQNDLVRPSWLLVMHFSMTSVLERFSENFDQETVTYLIFVGMHWFQKCNFWKKIPEPLLRSPRSLRSNDLETQKNKNSKWKPIENRWNPKFGLQDLKNGLLTSRISEGAQWIFPKNIFF